MKKSNTTTTNTSNTKSSNASNELTKSLNDLNDEVLDLAIEINDTTKQANNLETAFDITTDSTLDLAKAENDLTKSINTKNDSVNQSIDINDNLAYSQKETLELEIEYQKTLKRKLEIEQKLNKQREIIKYSDNIEKVPDYVQKEPSYNLNQHLEDNNLSDLKKYKAELEKINKQKEQGTFKKLSSKSISGIGNFAKMGLSKCGSLLENAMGLQQIPLYNESKELTQGIIKKSSKGISNIGSGIKEKLIERKFNKEKEKSTKEFYSNNNSTSKENNFNAERNQNQVLVQEKEERNQNKTERDKSNTRHNEQMKSLSVITDVLRENSLFAKLYIVFFSSIFSGVTSLITGIGGIATAIVGLGATIIAGFKGAIGGMLNKLWPGKFPDLEKDVDIDKSKNKNGDIDKAKSPNPNDVDKTKSPNPSDIDKAKSPNPSDIDKKPSDIDFKDGKEKPIDVDKSKSPKKAGESVFKKIGKQGLKGIGLRALGAATGVGGAMLTAEAAYYMLDSATDGKFSESTDNLMQTMSPENKPLDKIGAIQSGTLSESERAHLGKEQADKIQKERAEQKERSKEAFNVGFKNNVNANHQNNNIYMAGFYGLTPNIHNQVPSYGVTSG